MEEHEDSRMFSRACGWWRAYPGSPVPVVGCPRVWRNCKRQRALHLMTCYDSLSCSSVRTKKKNVAGYKCKCWCCNVFLCAPAWQNSDTEPGFDTTRHFRSRSGRTKTFLSQFQVKQFSEQIVHISRNKITQHEDTIAWNWCFNKLIGLIENSILCLSI